MKQNVPGLVGFRYESRRLDAEWLRAVCKENIKKTDAIDGCVSRLAPAFVERGRNK
jgi:hypothetical protein